MKNATPAKIGFVIYYPFQFYVYKNVYEHLRDEAEFIVDLGLYFPTRQSDDVLPSIERLLQSHGARYRVLPFETYYARAAVEQFLSQYDTLVSVWNRGCVTHAHPMLHRLVLMPYGFGKDLTKFDLAKSVFDLHLAYGPRDQAFYEQVMESVMVGNPKFDDWFAGRTNVAGIDPLLRRLDRSKRTVLYLPTHSDLSSIDVLAPALKTLGETYNVIVKLHYLSPREEPDRVTLLTDERLMLVQDDTDLMPLLKLADVIISDNSSAIFDAILADKPLVVTDFHDKEYLDHGHRAIKWFRRGPVGALTYSGSIEQRIKRDEIVDAIREPLALISTVEQILTSDTKRPLREKLRSELCSFFDQHAGKRAAEAIREFRSCERKPRPLLFHLIQKHREDLTRRRSWVSAVRDYSAVQQRLIEKFPVLGAPQFSVLLLRHPAATAASRAAAVEALASQQLSAAAYEVVHDDGDGALGTRVIRALMHMKAPIVCFTTDAHVVPSDWLLAIQEAFARYPDAAGVGGYSRAIKDAYSLYDECRYFEIGRLLHVTGEKNYLTRFYDVVTNVTHANPVGDLASFAIYKGALPSIPSDVNALAELGFYLKREVMRERPIAFIPNAPTRVVSTSRREFMTTQLQYGAAHHDLPLPHILRDALVALRHPARFRFMRIVLLAHLLRWLSAVHVRLRKTVT